jgi:hypothetical protein
MISKWARALRYAARRKGPGRRLHERSWWSECVRRPIWQDLSGAVTDVIESAVQVSPGLMALVLAWLGLVAAVAGGFN